MTYLNIKTIFMKEVILNLLKTKFVGLSDNVLEGTADKLSRIVTDEDGAKKAVEEVTLQKIVDSYTDNRVTTATKTAVTNYEKKYGLKDGEKQQQQQPLQPQPNKPDDDTSKQMPEWAKALMEANTELKQKLATFEQDKLTANRSGQLTDLIKGLTPTQQKAYGRINLSAMSEEEFTTLLTEVTAEVKELTADNKAQQAVTTKPVFGSPKAGEATDEEVNRLMGIKQ